MSVHEGSPRRKTEFQKGHKRNGKPPSRNRYVVTRRTTAEKREKLAESLTRLLGGLGQISFHPSAYEVYPGTDRRVPESEGRTWILELSLSPDNDPLGFHDVDGQDVRLLLADVLSGIERRIVDAIVTLREEAGADVGGGEELPPPAEVRFGTTPAEEPRYAVCEVTPFRVLTRMRPKSEAEGFAQIWELTQRKTVIVPEPYTLPDEAALYRSMLSREVD